MTIAGGNSSRAHLALHGYAGVNRILWDRGLDVDTLLDDHFQRCYSTTGKQTRQFHASYATFRQVPTE